MGFANEVGIDLGTANVLVYIKGKGIVLSEPSVVAINNDTDEILAVGEEARQMLGRTPSNIVAIRPLRDGVVSDYDITERMLKYFIRKTCGNGRFFKPRIMVCVPSGVTEGRAGGGGHWSGTRYKQTGRNNGYRYRWRHHRHSSNFSGRNRRQLFRKDGGRQVRRGHSKIYEKSS